MTTLRFGFVTGAAREEVEALEELPIASLWAGGHVASPHGVPETMIVLARLAALTRRVRIGTSVLLLPLYPPAIIAKQMADLDHVTGGRITMGVGVGGEFEQEFRACGVPVEERGSRTNKSIELLRRLWTGETISHEGPFYPMKQVRIQPAPVQVGGPPIIVGGRKEPAMARAAKLGDGWMPYLYSPRAYASSVQRIREIAADVKRDLARFEWMLFVFVTIRDDGERAREEAAAILGGTYNQDFRAFADRVTIAGTAEQVTARLQAYVDAGARHIIFAIAAKEDRFAMMHRLATEIFPKIIVAEG